MIDWEGMIDIIAKEPIWKMMAELLVEVYSTMPKVIARSAWIKMGFDWF